MNNKYLFTILLTFIFNGEILASDTENENKNTQNTEITAREYSDLLEMKYDDFQNLLVAFRRSESKNSSIKSLVGKENTLKNSLISSLPMSLIFNPISTKVSKSLMFSFFNRGMDFNQKGFSTSANFFKRDLY